VVVAEIAKLSDAALVKWIKKMQRYYDKKKGGA